MSLISLEILDPFSSLRKKYILVNSSLVEVIGTELDRTLDYDFVITYLFPRFISLLQKTGRLLRNYTQNIDTLEQVAGITNVIQCHGKKFY